LIAFGAQRSWSGVGAVDREHAAESGGLTEES
jgi:hypothetical protein